MDNNGDELDGVEESSGEFLMVIRETDDNTITISIMYFRNFLKTAGQTFLSDIKIEYKLKKTDRNVFPT